MTNKDLLKLIQEYVNSQDDTSKDERYWTDKSEAYCIMDDFCCFLRSKDVRIGKLPELEDEDK